MCEFELICQQLQALGLNGNIFYETYLLVHFKGKLIPFTLERPGKRLAFCTKARQFFRASVCNNSYLGKHYDIMKIYLGATS